MDPVATATVAAVAVVVDSGPSTWGVEDWLKLIGGLVVAMGTLATVFVLPIINAMKQGQAQQAATAAISIEAQNRYNATRGAEPVTVLSPPMGTGDGRIDKAITNQLSNAPTSPTTVPAEHPALTPPVEQPVHPV